MWEGDVWVAVRAARAGADVVRYDFDREVETELKGAVDPVTETDRESEQAVRAVIVSHFPDDSILGEEEGGAHWRDKRVWIVDPLDGTVNFVHRIPHVAVSVALWDRGEPLVGVIIDVGRDEEFVAVVGEGASINGRPIQVSETATMDDSLIVTGFPYDRRERADAYVHVVGEVMKVTRGTRRLGAAALDLAWVACGRFDAYWEHGGDYGVQPWDIAAGALLVTEAGGAMTDQQGARNRLQAPAFVASNGKIHEELRAIVERTLPDHLM
jgi:myo-inositol-1(or 4)-monophosphatase